MNWVTLFVWELRNNTIKQRASAILRSASNPCIEHHDTLLACFILFLTDINNIHRIERALQLNQVIKTMAYRIFNLSIKMNPSQKKKRYLHLIVFLSAQRARLSQSWTCTVWYYFKTIVALMKYQKGVNICAARQNANNIKKNTS